MRTILFLAVLSAMFYFINLIPNVGGMLSK